MRGCPAPDLRNLDKHLPPAVQPAIVGVLYRHRLIYQAYLAGRTASSASGSTGLPADWRQRGGPARLADRRPGQAKEWLGRSTRLEVLRKVDLGTCSYTVSFAAAASRPTLAAVWVTSGRPIKPDLYASRGSASRANENGGLLHRHLSSDGRGRGIRPNGSPCLTRRLKVPGTWVATYTTASSLS